MKEVSSLIDELFQEACAAIQDLVSEDQLGGALRAYLALTRVLSSDREGDALLLQSSLNRLQREYNNGVISFEVHSRESNRITLNLLDQLQRIKPVWSRTEATVRLSAVQEAQLEGKDALQKIKLLRSFLHQPEAPGAAAVLPAQNLVFLLYDPKEKDFAKELALHMSLIPGIHLFDMHEAPGFGEQQENIRRHLERSKLVLCLVSPRLFFTQQVLISQARKLPDLTVIPILIQPVNWEHTVLGGLTCLPIDKSFIATHANPDATYSDIARRLAPLIQS